MPAENRDDVRHEVDRASVLSSRNNNWHTGSVTADRHNDFGLAIGQWRDMPRLIDGNDLCIATAVRGTTSRIPPVGIDKNLLPSHRVCQQNFPRNDFDHVSRTGSRPADSRTQHNQAVHEQSCHAERPQWAQKNSCHASYSKGGGSSEEGTRSRIRGLSCYQVF